MGAYEYIGRIFYMNVNIEYKTLKLIVNLLKDKLESDKNFLVAQQKDKGCPAHIYKNTLDRCEELEYTIKRMEKLI